MNDDVAMVLVQAKLAALAVYLVEYMKKSPRFSAITPDTKTLNRWIGLGMAAVMALGVHFEFNAIAGDLTIHGLIPSSLSHAAWDIVSQWALQQVGYDVLLDRKRTIDAPPAPAPAPVVLA